MSPLYLTELIVNGDNSTVLFNGPAMPKRLRIVERSGSNPLTVEFRDGNSTTGTLVARLRCPANGKDEIHCEAQEIFSFATKVTVVFNGSGFIHMYTMGNPTGSQAA